MFPPAFDYRRAGSVAEAVDLLAGDREAELLAGGHTLVPRLKRADDGPDLLVDVGGVEALAGVAVSADAVRVGALTTYDDFLAADVADACPAVVDAARDTGDLQVRNAATLGGNLAAADPMSDLTAPVLAAGATLHVEGPDGKRTVPAGEFFRGPGETALRADDVLTAVEVPAAGDGTAGAYAAQAAPDSRLALVGVAVRLGVADGRVTDARVAATGAVDRPTRLTGVEEALVGASADPESAAAAEAAGDALTGVERERLVEDHRASADFRAHLLGVYAERAIRRALDRAS